MEPFSDAMEHLLWEDARHLSRQWGPHALELSDTVSPLSMGRPFPLSLAVIVNVAFDEQEDHFDEDIVVPEQLYHLQHLQCGEQDNK